MITYHNFIGKMHVVYNTELFENVKSVVLSPHAKIRSIERYGEKINVSKETIDAVVWSAEEQIMQWAKKFDNFVVYDKKTTLNVIGTIHEIGKNDYEFYVATVMYKKNFMPKNPSEDKKLTTVANIYENSNMLIYGY